MIFIAKKTIKYRSNFAANKFYKRSKKSELLFTENGVELYVYLENQKMSSMNGAVGLQPNPQTQSIGLTGDVQIKLLNIFKKAELIDVNWRSIEPQTQALQAKLNYPFYLNHHLE